MQGQRPTAHDGRRSPPCPLLPEGTGDLIAKPGVLGAKLSDLGPGGLQPLAERVDTCPLVRRPGGGRTPGRRPQADDGGTQVILTIEPSSGHPGGEGDAREGHGVTASVEVLDGNGGPTAGRVVSLGGGRSEVVAVAGPGHCVGPVPSSASSDGMMWSRLAWT